MNILKFPHPLLLTPTFPVIQYDDGLSEFLEEMFQTMLAANGLGLSANQVGLELSMFVMRGAGQEKLFVINPRVLEHSQTPAMLSEGCLSAPGDYVVLKERPIWVKIAFEDAQGITQDRIFHGIYAVCVMHEMDHLLGKSHLQSASLNRAERKALAKKWGLP